jgi:hypothetical protein
MPFFRVMLLIDLEVQLIAVLHSGSLASRLNILSLFLYFNSMPKQGRKLFNSENVILLVGSLYDLAIETVKSRAALSASASELISILRDIKFEARL